MKEDDTSFVSDDQQESFPPSRAGAVACLCLLLSLIFITPQSLRALESQYTITVVSTAPPRVRVDGRFAAETNKWVFLKDYAGVGGLGERVAGFTALDQQSAEIPVRLVSNVEFVSERPAKAFRYEVTLAPPAGVSDASHVSWLTGERGVLMPGDLLPQTSPSACLKLTLPQGWKSATLEPQSADGCYEVRDYQKSLFFVSPHLRLSEGRGRGLNFTFATDGKWAFTDEEVSQSVAEILKAHEDSTGATPLRKALVVLSPFPTEADANRWTAEARGGTVFILSGRLPAKVAALSRLNVALSHELFHLWVPNSLALRGAYDWFYEGFTLYHATRVGVQLGHLTFQNYVEAVARAYDNYLSARKASDYSLLDAGRERWGAAGDALIYHKGMLVAFLFDMELRRRSEGKKSLDDVYRALFRGKGPRAGSDANSTVIGVLDSLLRDASFSEQFFKSTRIIDLKQFLPAYGLRLENAGGRTKIMVAEPLDAARYGLLKKIGYNQNANR
ncbi:MAG: hypothetical protein ACRD9R_11265 [Pyrinomonadaceae bacterium]